MLKYLLQIYVLLFVIFTTSETFPATIFSDNFDSHADTCHTGGAVPSDWTMWYENDTYTSRDSVTHYSGEISSPGRGGTGKSLKIWRHSDWPPMNNYSGGLRYDFAGNYSNLFIRYFMKLPTSLSFHGSDYIKSWRFNTTGGSGEIYLDFRQENGGQSAAIFILAVAIARYAGHPRNRARIAGWPGPALGRCARCSSQR